MANTLAHDWFPQALPENVHVGERSWFYSSYAFIHYQSRQPVGVSMGHDSGMYGGHFDLGPEGKVEIGNFCSITGVTISTNSKVIIGDYTFISHEVIMADTFVAIPREGRISLPSIGPSSEFSDIIISENVWIGANAIILGGAHIGEGSIVGAGSVVNFKVPPFSIVAGNPAIVRGSVKQ